VNREGSIVKRRWGTLVAGLLIASSLAPGSLLAPASVRASFTFVDQHSESVPWEWLVKGDYAQTFTVGSTGSMTAVALWVFTSPNQHATVEVGISPLNASGFPMGFPLGTGYAAATSSDGFVTFSLPHFGVTAGQRLAIVFHVLSTCAIRGDSANPYHRGMAEEYSNGAWHGFQLVTTTDFAFKTYMSAVIVAPIPKTSLTPTPQPTPQPISQPTLHSTLTPTLSSAPTGTSVAASMVAAAATGTPAGVESFAAAGASGSAATTTGTFTPGGSTGSGGTNDVPLPAILAAIAALVVVLGGLAFLLLRRRRQPPEIAEASAKTR
jgi:hypothetical protein